MHGLTPNLKGALLGLLGFALYAVNDVVVKVLGQTYAPVQTLFFIMLFGFPVAIVMLLSDPAEASLRPRRPFWLAMRVVGFLLNALCGFYAFAVLPLTQVYALMFTGPLMITLLAVPVLGERLGVMRLGAVLSGFAGVLVVLRPGGGAGFELGHLAAFGAAFGAALAAVAARKVGEVERSAVLLLYPMMVGFVVAAAALPGVYKPPPLNDLALFGLVAALNFAATLTVMAAFRAGEAAVVSPMNYSQILWATAFGAAFFGEYPDSATFIGSAVIIGSGLFIILRENLGTRSRMRPVLTTMARLPLTPGAWRNARQPEDGPRR